MLKQIIIISNRKLKFIKIFIYLKTTREKFYVRQQIAKKNFF